jgi:hypothetical protein
MGFVGISRLLRFDQVPKVRLKHARPFRGVDLLLRSALLFIAQTLAGFKCRRLRLGGKRLNQ